MLLIRSVTFGQVPDRCCWITEFDLSLIIKAGRKCVKILSHQIKWRPSKFPILIKLNIVCINSFALHPAFIDLTDADAYPNHISEGIRLKPSNLSAFLYDHSVHFVPNTKILAQGIVVVVLGGCDPHAERWIVLIGLLSWLRLRSDGLDVKFAFNYGLFKEAWVMSSGPSNNIFVVFLQKSEIVARIVDI